MILMTLELKTIKSELQVVYDKYVGTTGDVTEALQVVSETVNRLMPHVH